MKFLFCPNCGNKLVDEHIDGRMRRVCHQCSYVHYKNPIPAAGVVLCRDGEILLVQRKYEPKKGHWSLPAGFVEYDEGPQMTAVRETREETGFEVDLKELFNVYGAGDDPRSHVVLVIYTAEITGGTLTPGDDAIDAQFFPLTNLPGNIAFSSHRQAIERYITISVGAKHSLHDSS